MIQIFKVEDVLARENPKRPLTLSPLIALDSRRELYSTMLLQPEGNIVGNENRVGNADQTGATAMYLQFLREAMVRQIDLVVTPEYSVPWHVVNDIAPGTLCPPKGAIWALGCESITPAEFRHIKQQINERSAERMLIIHEPFDSRQEAQKRYIDPLLYAFWATDPDGAEVLCLLVQFKTEPCRDHGDVELRSLYLGSRVYVFNEGVNCIRLLGIICSDAFAFTDELVDACHRNSLILHIQLNPNPTHPDYARYRNRLFSVGSKNHSELLCLNWARNVVEHQANNSNVNWNNIAGSVWYITPDKFAGRDTAINSLHFQGAYHSLAQSNKWHAFFFNYAPQVFIIHKQKVFNSGPQRIATQIGVESVQTLAWDAAANQWTAIVPDDGFSSLLNNYNHLKASLIDFCSTNPIGVERALEMLEGPSGTPDTWYRYDELDSWLVGPDESIKRVTVHQQIDNTKSGVQFRLRRLTRAESAITLHGQGIDWPPEIADIGDGFRFVWSELEPHSNIQPSRAAVQSATLVYLGEEANINVVRSIYKKLAQALFLHASRRANENNDLSLISCCKDRLCVVYRDEHRYQVFRSETRNSIVQPGDASPVDIGGEGE